MPIFKQDKIVLSIKPGQNHCGILPIKTEGDVFFACYCESLKGIVTLDTQWIEGVNPSISYVIRTEGLVDNFGYEDCITLYYPGGTNKITFYIHILDSRLNHGPEDVATQQRSNSFEEIDNTTLVPRKSTNNYVKVHGLKKTYHPNEIIQLTLISRLPHMTQITLQASDEMITPKKVDIFVKDTWTQEWFVKKSSFDMLLTKWMRKVEVEKTVTLSLKVNGTFETQQDFVVCITPFEPYLATLVIDSSRKYRQTMVMVLRQYMDICLNLRVDKTIESLLMSCLNFNQHNLQLRVFYIWFLNEVGHKKASREELQRLLKFTNKSQLETNKALIELIIDVVERATDEENDLVEIVKNKDNWSYILLKIRAKRSIRTSYSFFESLYNEGVKSSFLFSESVIALNKNPIIPKENDRFYLVCIQWAINHSVLGKDWLNKLDRYYYTIEKNPYLTSRLSLELYRLQKTPNMMRLVTYRCIQEAYYTEEVYEIFLQVMKIKLYIPKLESSYIRCCALLKKALDLDYITQTNRVEDDLKEFVYISIIKERLDFSILYKRAYPEIMSFILENKEITTDKYHLIRLLFHEIMKEHLDYMLGGLTTNVIKDMILNVYGLEILNAVIFTCLTLNQYVNAEQGVELLSRITKSIGFEGIMRCYENHEAVYRYIDMMPIISLDKLKFLPNLLYETKKGAESINILFLTQMLCDEFVDTIFATFQKLKLELSVVKEEFQSMQGTKTQQLLFYSELFFQYIGSKIAVEGIPVKTDLLEEFYDYVIHCKADDAALIYVLLKSIDPGDESWAKKLQNIYTLAIKHDIIKPWHTSLPSFDSMHVVEYLTYETDEVWIFYRYDEDEAFIKEPMRHIGFGVFIFTIKLFYGEFFDYYIKLTTDGKMVIPHSDILIQEHVLKNDSESSLYRINNTLDLINQAYELGDYQSAKILVNEAVDFTKKVMQIPRV